KHQSKWLPIYFLIASALLAAPKIHAETLREYAAECDRVIGATVPDFKCDEGTGVPVHNATLGANGHMKCDRPSRLLGDCEPGSRIQILETRSADAYAVALCRKKGMEDDKYGDIAVIQYNKKNGATCFYQAIGRELPGEVEAPSKSDWLWWKPSDTADEGCG